MSTLSESSYMYSITSIPMYLINNLFIFIFNHFITCNVNIATERIKVRKLKF